MNRIKWLIGFLLYPVLLYSQNFSADNTTFCDTGRVIFTSTAPGSVVKWIFGNGDTGTTNPDTVIYRYPGRYTVTLYTNIPDTFIKVAYITVRKVPPVIIKHSDSITTGSYNIRFDVLPKSDDTIKLTYHWNFGDQQKVIDTNSVKEHLYPQPGKYKVTVVVVDSNGCASGGVKEIEVVDRLEVPNVFSPNNDGINDIFRIECNGVSSITFKVYNSWGVEVFTRTAPVILWDGHSSSGQELKPGLYFYVLQTDDGREKNGHLYMYK